MKKYKKSVFLFTRDYRLEDNTGLIQALHKSKTVYPIFVFTPEQIDDNHYKSNNAVQFIVQSLAELEDALKKHKGTLSVFHGNIQKTLGHIHSTIEFDALYLNEDYTPFARKRADMLAVWCKKNAIDLHMYEDALLHPLHGAQSILNAQHKAYVKFTPFFNTARKKTVVLPQKNHFSNYAHVKLPGTLSATALKKLYTPNSLCAQTGGRTHALTILQNIDTFKDYEKTHDFFARTDSTTMLSAHLRFGTISIREAYFAIKQAHIPALARQLYWRDFYYMLVYHMPSLTERGTFTYQPTWENTYLKKVIAAQTGVPLVDAGLMQLYTTGWMHNRVRMVVASFITKNLLIDWKEGEKLYGKFLVDHDRCVNLGNWHFMASTSAFSMMRSRLLNPYIQSKKFDKECIYIKKWLPHLKNVPPQHIHTWEKWHTHYKKVYPAPIVSFAESKEYFLKHIKK